MPQSDCEQSDYKLCFKLKQHTPLIHFQADQKGATLRATELKPKLDRFIKYELKIVDNKLYKRYEKLIKNEYYFPLNKGSNVYKINISAGKIKDNIEFSTYFKRELLSDTKRIGSYFGNLKAIENSNIQITIKSLIPDIVHLVKIALEHVLIYENFGSRQTKGFGSFTLEKTSQDSFEAILSKKYKLFYKKSANDVLKMIMSDYQHLKSGKRTMNDEEYDKNKSKLFNYMCNKHIRWEKRMIKVSMKESFYHIYKQMKFEHEPVRCNSNDEHYKYQYIRALLGYSENHEYLKKDSFKQNNKDKIVVQINSIDESLERYKSPITYKVFDNIIYVLPNPNSAIEGKKFNFKIKGENTNLNEEPIVVPNDFDLIDFLKSTLVSDFNYEEVSS